MIALWFAKFKAQLITGAVVLAAAGALYFYVNHLQDVIAARDKSITDISTSLATANANLVRADQVRREEENKRAKAEANLLSYLDTNKRIIDENNELNKCIATGDNCVRLRKPVTKSPTAPRLPGPSATACSSETTGTELDRATQYNISILKRDTEIVLNMLDVCLKDDALKSGPEVKF